MYYPKRLWKPPDLQQKSGVWGTAVQVIVSYNYTLRKFYLTKSKLSRWFSFIFYSMKPINGRRDAECPGSMICKGQ